MRPILPLLGDSQRLFISPDGSLNLVPFAALQSATGRYLVESHDISYLTSGRDLGRLQERAPESGRSLIVANPQFGSAAAEAASLLGTSHKPALSICRGLASRRCRAPLQKRLLCKR